jgi:hypothetical protein
MAYWQMEELALWLRMALDRQSIPVFSAVQERMTLSDNLNTCTSKHLHKDLHQAKHSVLVPRPCPRQLKWRTVNNPSSMTP